MSTACAPLSDFKISSMQRALDHTVPGPKQRDGTRKPEYDSQLTALNYACVDQDVIIVHDPSMLLDRPGRAPTQRPTHVPHLDFSGDPYYFRQASQLLAYDKLKSLGHGADLPARDSLTSTVLGYAFASGGSGKEPHNEIVVRMASPDEVKALAQPFSTCTTPLIFQSLWMHNLNEWMSRGPVAFHKQQVARKVLPGNLSIVLHSPLKIPVPKWNLEVLKPFSTLAPSSLADFSSRLPPDTPSASTHEGTHIRCFRKLLVWREVREDRPYTAMHLGRLLLDYHAPTLRSLDTSERPFWRSRAPTHMRVLIERRNTYGKTGTRQFLHLDTLLQQCQAVGASWPVERGGRGARGRGRSGMTTTTDGGGGGSASITSTGTGTGGGGREDGRAGDTDEPGAPFTSVECVPHAFGKHPAGIVHDMWVMRDVDVFVTFHGAGEMNAIFMPEHASLIEVRGLNASRSLADHWHPMISRYSGFRYFWWGLFMQDPEYVGRSGLDEEGFYADAERNWKSFMLRKRDQNVRLTWPHLSFMLEKVRSLNRNVTRFRKMFGGHFDYYGTEQNPGVVYEVLPGHRLPQRHKGASTLGLQGR